MPEVEREAKELRPTERIDENGQRWVWKELRHGQICYAKALLGEIESNPGHDLGEIRKIVVDILQKRVNEGKIEHRKEGSKSFYGMWIKARPRQVRQRR